MLLPDEREVMNDMVRHWRSFIPSEVTFYRSTYLTLMRFRRMREASRVRQQKFVANPFSLRRGIYG